MITLTLILAILGADDPILGPLNLDAKTRERVVVLSTKCAEDLQKILDELRTKPSASLYEPSGLARSGSGHR